MVDLAPHWNGRLYGTNTGNVSMAVQVDAAGQTTAEARLLDDAFGVVVYQLTGTWNGASLALSGHGLPANNNVQVGHVTLTGTLAPDGRLLGPWTSTLGTGGSFVLYPHLQAAAFAPAGPGTVPPDQIHFATQRIGAIRLFREDIVELVRLMLADFNQQRLAVTYDNGSTNAVVWSDDFLAQVTGRKLRYVKFNIKAVDEEQSGRTIIIEFGRIFNELTVQGESPVWVTGKFEILRRFLASKVSPFASQYHIWNVGFYQVLLLVLVVMIPSVQGLGQRAVLAFVYAVLVIIMRLIHGVLIPVSVVNMGERKPGLLRYWPSWVSWIAAILSALVIAKAGGWIEGAATFLLQEITPASASKPR